MTIPIDRVRLLRERFHTRVLAGIQVILEVDGESLTCTTRNISHGGMCVLTEKKLRKGKEMVLRVTHHDQELSTKAAVASIAPNELGLRFVEPTEQFQVAIAELITELRSRQDTPLGAPGVLHDHVRVAVAWSHVPTGKWWSFFKDRRHPANVFSLTDDGAALVSTTKTPQVGETVVVYLHEDEEEEARQCQAEVVRHTARGFAVRFVSPDAEFVDLVARLRCHDLGPSSDL